jgi:type I restriction enzyme R subunit
VGEEKEDAIALKENINQNPEQIARDNIDKQLSACRWIIQCLKHVNLHTGVGVAVREYLTDVGPADYVLFVEGKPCGVIEAKREEEGHRLATRESVGIARKETQ